MRNWIKSVWNKSIAASPRFPLSINIPFLNVCKWTQATQGIKCLDQWISRTFSLDTSFYSLEPSSSTIKMFPYAGKRTDPPPFPISADSGLQQFGEWDQWKQQELVESPLPLLWRTITVKDINKIFKVEKGWEICATFIRWRNVMQFWGESVWH